MQERQISQAYTASSEAQTLCNLFLQCFQSEGAAGRNECKFSLHSFPARKQRQLSTANSPFSVVLSKSRTGEALISGIEGIKSCQRSAKKIYPPGDF